MRLWSIHPKYLDARGLVALWREGLLARKVLAGGTVGYRHHPQLVRFKGCLDPVAAVDAYLTVVAQVASERGYCFDHTKIVCRQAEPIAVNVTLGQIGFEWQHLCAKVSVRDPRWFAGYPTKIEMSMLVAHPCFIVIPGPVEPWERASAAMKAPTIARVGRRAPSNAPANPPGKTPDKAAGQKTKRAR